MFIAVPLLLLASVLAVFRFVPLVDPVWLVGQWPVLDMVRPDPGGIAAATFGLLIAALLYVRHDVALMATGLVRAAKRRGSPGARLLAQIAIASVPPAAVLIAMWRGGWPAFLPPPDLMLAGGFIVGGLALLVADRIGFTVRRVEHLGYGGALLTGVFQAFATLPGLSQTGFVIVAARLMDYERAAALRLAVLLAIPWLAVAAILSAGALAPQPILLAAAVLAALIAYLVLSAAAPLLRRRSFTWFALAQVAGGALLLWERLA
jgi:undecaprenyl-diphosphatase